MAKRKDGKLDRRTSEYREAAERMAAARKALSGNRKGTRRLDGRLDKRTSEGRTAAERMAKVRALRGKSGGFFSWLFGK